MEQLTTGGCSFNEYKCESGKSEVNNFTTEPQPLKFSEPILLMRILKQM